MMPFAQHKVGAEALRVDGVLCDGQLLRLGVKPDLFPGREVAVKVNVSQPHTIMGVTFRALDARSLKYARASAMAHAAGTAEIRLLLGATPAQWRVSPLGGNLREPDARWASPQGEVLVEYDACGYPKGVVWRKMMAFRERGPVVWGTSSSLRGDRIRRRYPDARVLYVPWWEGPEARAHTLAGGNGGSRAARRALVLERTR